VTSGLLAVSREGRRGQRGDSERGRESKELGDREKKEEDSKGYYFPVVPFIITRVRGLKKGKEIYD